MRFLALLLIALTSFPGIAQTAADEYYDPAEMARARAGLVGMGGSLNSMIMGDRLENQVRNGTDSLVWDVQGWIGYDIDKLFWKTEGESHGEHAELQALWSHAVSPFWDLQAGLRHDFKETTRDYAVVGLMGLAPYWFEVDAAAFLSDKGDLSSRVEAEYELRFSQRLILQPRVELNYAFSDDIDAGIGSGFSKVETGLRLRYEFKREFAPYIGVAWGKSFGNTADLLRNEGKDTDEVSFVAGLRVWY